MATTVDTLLVRIEADMSDLKRDLQRVSKQTEQATNNMAEGFRKVGRAVAALGGAAIFGSFLKSTVQTGMQVEGLRIQLDALLGSTEEGGKAFQNMTRFASRVPFSLRQIQQGAGGLGAAAKNADELSELMQITGNIAAQFNIPFEEAAANVQRAMSAGAGAADQFRDRGVLAFAGFQQGVSYSASETAKILQDTFGTGGTADGAMDAFAKTTQGAMSMLGDAIFNFQSVMAESGLNEGLTNLVNIVTEIIKDSRVFAAVIGSVLGNALNLVGQAVQFVVTHMKDIIYYFGLFVAMRTVMAFGETALAAIKYARAINAVSLAKKTLSIMSRRNVLALLAVAGTVAFLGDEFDEFAQSVGELGEKIFSDLPPELKQYFDPVFKVIDDAVNAATAAQDFMNTPFGALGTGTTIQLSSTGVDADAMRELQKLIDKTQPATVKLREQVALLQSALGGMSGEAREKAVEALAVLEEKLRETEPMYASFKNAVQSMATNVSNAFADMLANGKLNMDSLKDIFRSFVKTMIAKAIELFVINRILSMIFPGAYMTTAAGAFVPRASGGAMSARQPYLVGERGPELVVPNSASTVMNSNNTRSALGSGGDTTIVQNINISTGVQQTVRSEIRSLMPEIANTAKAAVADTKRRGGSYGRAFA